MGAKKVLGAAAATLVLAGGAVVGVLLVGPLESGAQEEPTTSTVVPAERGHIGRGDGSQHVTAAAEALGLEPEELAERMRGGSTIAEIAEAEGVDLQTVIDAMVAAEQERLAELEASAEERMTAIVNGEGPFRGGPDHRPRGHGEGGAFGFGGGFNLGGLGEVAEILELEPRELVQTLRDGSTLAEIAQDQGVETQAVIEALVANAHERIDDAVADGRLTEEQAAEKKAAATERATERIDQSWPQHGGRDRPGGADSGAEAEEGD